MTDDPKLGRQLHSSTSGGRKALSAAGSRHLVQPSVGWLYPLARESGLQAEPAFCRPAFKHHHLLERGQKRRRKEWGNKRTGIKQAAWRRVAGKRGSRRTEGSLPPPPQCGGLSPRLYHSTFLQGQRLGRHVPGGLTPRPGGAQPKGTAAVAKPGEGLGGPLGFAHSGCPQPDCRLSPTLPCPPKRRRGLAAGRVWWEKQQGRRAAGKARTRPADER